MTQKELSYVEDAIGHEATLISVLEDTKEKLDNEGLIPFIETNIENHTSIKEELMNLLEGKVND